MRKNIRLLLLTLPLAAFIAACSSQDVAPVQADNTARNADSPAAQTPVDQAENASDLEITANIRKAIVADDSLSVNAHNVKIITAGGNVTLRGPVRTEAEKEVVQEKAAAVAGATNVTSTLSIMPAKSSTPKQPS